MSGLSGIAPAVLRSLECLRRVGNGPRHRRPCRCYIRHAARRHGNTVRPCGSPMDPMHDRDRVAVRLGWSGMVLAIGDLAGATFVTLLAAVWEGMSNPVPVRSPRKSAAIIPFVNKTLTS